MPDPGAHSPKTHTHDQNPGCAQAPQTSALCPPPPLSLTHPHQARAQRASELLRACAQRCAEVFTHMRMRAHARAHTGTRRAVQSQKQSRAEPRAQAPQRAARSPSPAHAAWSGEGGCYVCAHALGGGLHAARLACACGSARLCFWLCTALRVPVCACVCVHTCLCVCAQLYAPVSARSARRRVDELCAPARRPRRDPQSSAHADSRPGTQSRGGGGQGVVWKGGKGGMA